MRANSSGRAVAALRLDKPYHVGSSVTGLLAALAIMGAGIALGGPATSTRTLLLVVGGGALSIIALLMLLRESRVVPPVIAFRAGEKLVALAISLRRPVAVASVHDPVGAYSVERHYEHTSPLRGRVRRNFHIWTVQIGERGIEWSMLEVMPPAVAAAWTIRLQELGSTRDH